MFGLTRWDPFQDTFNFQREVDRLFNRFWSDLPARTAASPSGSFQVNPSDDAWRIDIPLAGIDPEHVTIEAAGNTLSIRAEEPTRAKENTRAVRYEQTLTVPQFLDLDQITASYRHGMLELTMPLKESVKPRRIQIESVNGDRKQLTAA
jgi:HSP20 family protein